MHLPLQHEPWSGMETDRITFRHLTSSGLRYVPPESHCMLEQTRLVSPIEVGLFIKVRHIIGWMG